MTVPLRLSWSKAQCKRGVSAGHTLTTEQGFVSGPVVDLPQGPPSTLIKMLGAEKFCDCFRNCDLI